MAEGKPPSTTDLFLLIAGVQVLKSPDDTADSGEDYYLNEPQRTEERTLRDTSWNRLWFSSPGAAWEKVRYRDWLIARLAQSIASDKPEFSAISELLLVFDGRVVQRVHHGMAGATNEINEVLVAKSGKRSFFSALSLGLSKTENRRQGSVHVWRGNEAARLFVVDRE
jgi:hypothetical protein